jgi:hypothetical protein
MPNSFTAPIFAFASRLRFPTLFMVTLALFILDVLIPDFIPLADELLLGLGALLLSHWKNGKELEPKPPIDVTPQ